MDVEYKLFARIALLLAPIFGENFVDNNRIKYNKGKISRKNEHKNVDVVLLGF